MPRHRSIHPSVVSSAHKASHFGYFSSPSRQWAGKRFQSQSGAAGDPAGLNAQRRWKRCRPWADKPGFPRTRLRSHGTAGDTLQLKVILPQRRFPHGCRASRSRDTLGPKDSVAAPAPGSDTGQGEGYSQQAATSGCPSVWMGKNPTASLGPGDERLARGLCFSRVPEKGARTLRRGEDTNL